VVERSRSRELEPIALVAGGAIAGVLYVLFDMLSEARILHGSLTGAMANAHALVDHVSPVVIGAVLGFCVHVIRVRAHQTATREAADRAEALRSRLQKVERDQAVWVLAAAVLHELNNPLHALGLLLDELGACEDDPERASDLVARARAQSGRALQHLKALRGMRSGEEPAFQRVALDRVIGAVAADVGALAADDGFVVSVSVECRSPVAATADPAYVRAILENMLENSLHSLKARRGGAITIRVDVEEGRAVVHVQDDGPAIDPSVRTTLFEPMRSTKAHGLGLGLPIARALARAMRGDLSLEDADCKAFRLELPLTERA
jgi:two-component system C4-dicarboxylate transport sensor histidine kinase DctB